MDTQNVISRSAAADHAHNTVTPQAERPNLDQHPKAPSIVPKGITISMAVLALILSLAGYGARLIAGHDTVEVLRHAATLVPAFIIGIPLLFWIGSRIFNKIKGTNIQGWNAISLGYLTSCISLLWLMGTYS